MSRGYYYWDKKVQFKVKPICYSSSRSYDCMYLNYDSGLYTWWPKYSIAFYNDSEEYDVIIDDFDSFETYKYNLNVADLDKLKSILNDYSDDIYILLAKNSDYAYDAFTLGELRIESCDSEKIQKNKYGELGYLKNHDIAYEIRDKLNDIIKKYNPDYKIKISTCKELV